MTLTEERSDAPRRPWGKRQAPRARMEGNLLPTNLTLTREQIEWLDARADREGRSRSDVARALIQGAIRKDREKEARRAKKEQEP
jgi:alkanesulfonate monooxygenase SsuD/methylene tetrahydromethanopterin reductase-like flavin-dependent oxidoreductase (luciferase family)